MAFTCGNNNGSKFLVVIDKKELETILPIVSDDLPAFVKYGKIEIETNKPLIILDTNFKKRDIPKAISNLSKDEYQKAINDRKLTLIDANRPVILYGKVEGNEFAYLPKQKDMCKAVGNTRTNIPTFVQAEDSWEKVKKRFNFVSLVNVSTTLEKYDVLAHLESLSWEKIREITKTKAYSIPCTEQKKDVSEQKETIDELIVSIKKQIEEKANPKRLILEKTNEFAKSKEDLTGLSFTVYKCDFKLALSIVTDLNKHIGCDIFSTNTDDGNSVEIVCSF